MKNTDPTFGIIATAVTRDIIASPALEQVVENWTQMGRKIVFVTPPMTDRPPFPRVRHIASANEKVTLVDVINAALQVSEGTATSVVLADPMVVMRFAIFDIFKIAVKRQLGNSWVAAGLCQKLPNYMEGGPLESENLRWFATSDNVLNYAARSLDPTISFASPLWGGAFATWATRYVHHHRYHDVTSLDALGLLPGPTIEASADELSYFASKLTSNPPLKSYLAADRR